MSVLRCLTVLSPSTHADSVAHAAHSHWTIYLAHLPENRQGTLLHEVAGTSPLTPSSSLTPPLLALDSCHQPSAQIAARLSTPMPASSTRCDSP
ncbi:hypothetical protein B0H15DRAFT_443457 [Mycena belliarum]|uniref:Uncharacterized protein n=1 Tax=Mycena belliarum TaxID=1033014 RepID=A0AAD6TWG4_9AGAR|nr:hypothetical protein B0H15DRAFT_443457 [Mycena belliae]